MSLIDLIEAPISGAFCHRDSEKGKMYRWTRLLCTNAANNSDGYWEWDKWEKVVEGLVRDLKRNGINL